MPDGGRVPDGGHAGFVYRVAVYREGLLSSLIFGAAKANAERFTDFLNDHATNGWRVVAVEKDVRRLLLFFTREAYVIVLERPAGRRGMG
ncbi:MAG: DUF4177 domain-containing protein [Pseudomonadota bacterium]